jgi:peptidoglycan/LPS O-acetylase OafA/YrhL
MLAPIRKALYLAGEASYSIYLIHPFALAPCAWVIARFAPPGWGMALLVVMAPLAAFVVSLAAWRLVETPLTEACGRLLGLRTSGRR